MAVWAAATKLEIERGRRRGAPLLSFLSCLLVQEPLGGRHGFNACPIQDVAHVESHVEIEAALFGRLGGTLFARLPAMASKPKHPYTIIRGGKLLDIAKRKAAPADILIKGDTIAEIGRPGLAAPAGAAVIDARNRLMHPGLINAHTHGPGNLGKGMGDRWSLELLLTASQWIGGGRTLEDKYLSAMIGAAEMVLKGCTAAYDLAAEFPLPSVEGLSAMAKAYEEVGMRCVLAPMVADITFFEAIPGLMERLPPALQKEVESFKLAPWKATTKQMKKALQKWPFEKVAARRWRRPSRTIAATTS